MSMAPGGGNAPPPAINPLAQALMAFGGNMLSQGYSTMPRSGLEGFGSGLTAGMSQYQNALAGQQQMEMQYAKLQQEEEQKKQREAALADIMKSNLLTPEQKALLQASGASPQTLQYGSQMVNQALTAQRESEAAAAQKAAQQQQMQDFMGTDMFKNMAPEMQQMVQVAAQNLPAAALQPIMNAMGDQYEASLKGAGEGAGGPDPYAGDPKMDNAHMIAMQRFAREYPGVDPRAPEAQAQIQQWQIEEYEGLIAKDREEDAYSSERGKVWGQQYKKRLEDYDSAEGALRVLDQMDTVSSQTGNTGYFSGPLLDVQRAAAQIADIVPSLSGAANRLQDMSGTDPDFGQAMQALNKDLALKVTNQLSGQISNYELQFAQDAMPGLENTPEGRRLISGLLRNKLNRQKAEWLIEEELDGTDLSGPARARELRRLIKEADAEFKAANDALIQTLPGYVPDPNAAADEDDWIPVGTG